MDGKRYIFYDTSTGEVIVEESRNRASIMPTIERVIAIYPKLHDRDPSTYDVLILDYNDFLQDFIDCSGYRVNLTTKQLDFKYPDPDNPDDPQAFQRPLTEQVDGLKSQIFDLDTRLMMVEMGGM